MFLFFYYFISDAGAECPTDSLPAVNDAVLTIRPTSALVAQGMEAEYHCVVDPTDTAVSVCQSDSQWSVPALACG